MRGLSDLHPLARGRAHRRSGQHLALADLTQQTLFDYEADQPVVPERMTPLNINIVPAVVKLYEKGISSCVGCCSKTGKEKCGESSAKEVCTDCDTEA
ncbi:MAG TPA: hypothetical protein VGM92_07940 [Candidatus Kapabacteria bacterium]|jgi:hypothetical protein